MANFCPKCGEDITEKVKFCPKCGADIDSFLKKPDENIISEESVKSVKNLDIKSENTKNNTLIPKENIVEKKDIFLSIGCSFFIPGLGQFYNGDTYKAVGLGFGILISIFLFKPLIFLIWLIGIVDAYYVADQINKERIPFKPTDSGDMIIYAVLFLLIIGGSFYGSGLSSGSTTLSSGIQNQNSNINTLPLESQYEKNIRISNEIVANYHQTHTYSLNDLYVCGDMASDIWDMLKAQGINAKINVGNVDKDITDIKDANHAWVLAEVAPNQYLALEATGGYSVQLTNNPRYYTGWSFYNPKQLKNYLQLNRQLNDAIDKYNVAKADYNNFVAQYNDANFLTKLSWNSQLNDKQLILNQRIKDINDINQQMNALLSSL